MSKRKCISLECKRLIIIDVEKGALKKSEIAKKHGIPPSSVSTILKNKAEIFKNAEKEQYSNKRIRKCLYEDVDEAMLEWTKANRAKNLPFSGPLIRKKAKEIAEELGHVKFRASVGWLDKFKKRHGIVERTSSGESPWASFCAVENVQTTLDEDITVDKDILQGVNSCWAPKISDSDENNENIAQAVTEIPSCQNALRHIEGLRSFIEARENIPNNVLKSLAVLEFFIDKEKWKEFT